MKQYTAIISQKTEHNLQEQNRAIQAIQYIAHSITLHSLHSITQNDKRKN